ncbi:hypothetical protein CHS0354_039476 [Potamilus streckersoni]|uniref:Uncharacterized protein n=1 Tax=Potamilus streckersoni TaxID=2493646 RepID=A0AAE0TKX7_9BIVA|nr:hypothetical protein CHS0354_039476 [Potamilus streckersoni]
MSTISGTSITFSQTNRTQIISIEPSFNTVQSTSLHSTIYRQFITTDEIQVILPSISLTQLKGTISMRNTFTEVEFSTMGNMLSGLNARSSFPYKHLVKDGHSASMDVTVGIFEITNSESEYISMTNEIFKRHARALGINSSSSSLEYNRTQVIPLPSSFSSFNTDSLFGVSNTGTITATLKRLTLFSLQPSTSNIPSHRINKTTGLPIRSTMTTMPTVSALASNSTHYTQSILFLNDSTSKSIQYSSIHMHRSVSSGYMFASMMTTDYSTQNSSSLDSVKLSSSSSHHITEILLNVSSSISGSHNGYPTQLRYSMHSSVLPQDSSINSLIFTNKSVLRPSHNNIVLPAFPGSGSINFTSGRDNCDVLTKRIPHTIVFNETEPAGTVFFRLKTLENFTLDVKITEPSEVTSVLGEYLKFKKSNDSYMFTLNKPIDIEEVFEITGRVIRLKSMKVTVTCKHQVSRHSDLYCQSGIVDDGEAIINVTVLDVDDRPPHFVFQGDTNTCAVPVYSADTSEHYTVNINRLSKQYEIKDSDYSIISDMVLGYARLRIIIGVVIADDKNVRYYLCFVFLINVK